MMRALSLAMCLVLPTAAFAEGPGPAVDQPVAAEPALTPQADSAAVQPQPPQPAVENARWCGAHGGCNGAGRGKGKWIVLGGVAGTVVTAVAVGLAVGFATRGNGQPQTP